MTTRGAGAHGSDRRPRAARRHGQPGAPGLSFRARSSRRRGIAALASSLFYLLLLLWIWVSPHSAPAVSFEDERALGQRFDLEAARRYPLVTDPEVVGYVERIGRRIVRRLEGSVFDYHFRVVANSNVNAFAVPGGYVYVHTGLLLQAANDDEVAAVLGHEVAHVHNHHLARQQEETRALNYATLLGMLAGVVQPAIGGVAAAANASIQLKYRREFEQEADFSGARYLAAAGFDPHAMLDFFQKLADQQRTAGVRVPPYLLSHPLTDDRLTHLESVFRTQQWATRKRAAPSFELLDAQTRARVRSEPPADALHAYRRLVDRNPDDLVARHQLGVVALEVGQYDLAAASLEKAAAAGKAATRRELGRLALRTRDLARARIELERAVKESPEDTGALADLGRVLEAAGDTTGARERYEAVLALAPETEPVQQALGVLLGRSGEEAAGFYHVATALRLRGDLAGAQRQYARAAQMLGENDPRKAEARNWEKTLSRITGVTVD